MRQRRNKDPACLDLHSKDQTLGTWYLAPIAWTHPGNNTIAQEWTRPEAWVHHRKEQSQTNLAVVCVFSILSDTKSFQMTGNATHPFLLQLLVHVTSSDSAHDRKVDELEVAQEALALLALPGGTLHMRMLRRAPPSCTVTAEGTSV